MTIPAAKRFRGRTSSAKLRHGAAIPADPGSRLRREQASPRAGGRASEQPSPAAARAGWRAVPRARVPGCRRPPRRAPNRQKLDAGIEADNDEGGV
eukprot:9751802-Alexandrium_andersonii.AAC.1